MNRSRFALPFVLFCLAAFPALALAQSVSVSIQNLTPGSTVSVGTTVSFDVIAAGFTTPTYTLSDSLSGSTVVSPDLNSAGHFVWTPQSADQGACTILPFPYLTRRAMWRVLQCK